MKMGLFNVQLSVFFNWILQSSLQASILICLILAIQGLLRGRLSARSQYVLWMLLLVRLVMPWAPASPMSIFNLVPGKIQPKLMGINTVDTPIDRLSNPEFLIASESTEVGIATNPETVSALRKAAVPSSPVETAKTLESVQEPLLQKRGEGEPDIITFDIIKLLPLLWLIVVLVLVSFGSLTYVRFWVFVRNQVLVTDQKVLELLRKCKIRMSTRTALAVIETNKVKTPTLFGSIRPVLLLPNGLMKTLSSENLSCIFLHELAHLKRHDILLGWLMNILQVLHWFNPIIWLGFWCMRRDRELACDALAMECIQEGKTYVYGKTIVHLLESFVQRRYLPSMVGILENKGQIKRRINMIARFRKNSQKISALALILMLVLGGVILTNAQENLKPTESGANLTEKEGSASGNHKLENTGRILGGPGKSRGEFTIIANAATASGEHLAKGTFSLYKSTEYLKHTGYGTRGIGREPVPMYMLFSYFSDPPMVLFKFPIVVGDTWTREVRHSANATVTIEGHETVKVPAGTFPESLKHKTIITGAQTEAEGGSEFVNGTRYLWFAKGVGLVKMLYQHSNGVTTEAELTKYNLVDKSEEYLPLKMGNTWTYMWKNDYRDEVVVETCRVGEAEEVDLKAPFSSKKKPYRAATKEVSITGIEKLDLSEDLLVHVAADTQKGFNFPYYLFIPKSIDRKKGIHILVETNNTGTCSDYFELHDQRAKSLVDRSHANKIARRINVPLLVPTFPRPSSQARTYTHSLDEDTLLIKMGDLKRIDLQLIEMIKDAQELLRENDVSVKDRVFMHGFSASGTFVNRFAILHPGIVRAVAAGGVNSIPTFPTSQWHGTELRYPVGIADLKDIADINFDENAYKKVSQYIYMGDLDRNDTTLFRDAYDEEDAKLIRTLIGEEMPKRWQVSQSIYRELQVPAQCVTYSGTGHAIRSEMIDDIVKFFAANVGEEIVEIEPHQYPFVKYKEIQEANINGLYWKGDSRIPEWARELHSGKGSFIICIEEWMEGQDHHQLDTFKENAGFNFVLKAEGHENISITKENSIGTMSSNDGSFQGFTVRLIPSQLEKLIRGVEYTILPLNESKEYAWKVKKEVKLIRPARPDEERSPEHRREIADVGAPIKLEKAAYKVTIIADEPRVANVTCVLTPKQNNGETIRLHMNNNGASDLPNGYAYYLRDITASDASENSLSVNEIGDARWWVGVPDNKSTVTLSYKALLKHDERDWEWGPDEAPYTKDDCVFWTGRALFIVSEVSDIELSFELPDGWRVSTPWQLVEGKRHTFYVKDHDDLTESFILVGTHFEHLAKSGDTEILLAIGGRFKKAKNVMQSTVEGFLKAYTELFGGAPKNRMLLVANPYDRNGSMDGGVFGRSISLLMGNNLGDASRNRWAPFVGHEVFHVWNGQAISYSGQEYWFSEGFTNYYSAVISARLGLSSEADFINRMERACKLYLSKQGGLSIRDAGSSKSSHFELVYEGGSLIGAALDLQIRKLTNNEKSLDDVMKQMYREFGITGTKYAMQDVIRIINTVSGADFNEFFQKYLSGRERLPLEECFSYAGLDVCVELGEELPSGDYVIHKMLHISSLTRTEEGLIVRRSRSAGYQDEDNLIAMNGTPVRTFRDMCRIAKDWEPGEEAELTILRNGKKIRKTITLGGEGEEDLPDRGFLIHKMLRIASLTGTDEGLIIRRSESAGYQHEDNLIVMAGTPVKTFDDMRLVAKDWKPGDEVELTILRSGKQISKKIILGGEGEEGLPDQKKLIHEMLRISSLTATPEGLVIRRSASEGYKDEDILVAMNGVTVKTFDEMRRAARGWKPDDEVELTILRKSKRITMPVILGGTATSVSERDVSVTITKGKGMTDLQGAILSGILKPKSK